MKKYIFPINYQYANKFLGMIEYRVLLPLSIYAATVFFILFLLKIDFFWGLGIFIVLVLPPTILLSVGIQGQNVVPFLLSVYRFKNKAKVYLYTPKNN